MQTTRDEIGPEKVNSGFRCHAHNRAVRGSPTSQHLIGRAGDVTPLAASLKDLFHSLMRHEWIEQCGVILYPGRGFIHFDVRGFFYREARLDGRIIPWQQGIGLL
jgi:uncharacterized protein YcbK (DUF882 family)